MMEVMSFWRRKERKVVATVSIDSGHQSHCKPQPGCSQMGTHDKWAQYNRHQIGHYVLDWMGVDADNSNWSRPLMMNFVDVFVHDWMMA